MVRFMLFGMVQLLLLQSCDSFVGFWETNYNETITVCVFDELRGAVLGRTHWPGVEFNEDSATLQGVLVGEGRELSGVGATITGGAYSFIMSMNESLSQHVPHHTQPLLAVGSFNFLDKVERGVWIWSYQRAPTAAECDLVTTVRAAVS
jgi:hypothetical protein